MGSPISLNALAHRSPHESEKPIRPTVFTLLFFMCSNRAVAISATGCGITTDHFCVAGVTGIGASAKCGTPTSLATFAIAMLGGVVDEPTRTSTLSSVARRRALVVAAVGSPASSSWMIFSLAPPISSGNSDSVLRSGMPSAAPCPVVEMLTPSLISSSAALAGAAAATIAATAILVSNAKDSLFIFMGFLRLIERRYKKLRRSSCPLIRAMNRAAAGICACVMTDNYYTILSNKRDLGKGSVLNSARQHSQRRHSNCFGGVVHLCAGATPNSGR